MPTEMLASEVNCDLREGHQAWQLENLGNLGKQHELQAHAW
jgi:hypothetical protein